MPSADGHLSLAPGTALAVTIADCVPVFLSHPGGSVGVVGGAAGAAAGLSGSFAAGLSARRSAAGAAASGALSAALAVPRTRPMTASSLAGPAARLGGATAAGLASRGPSGERLLAAPGPCTLPITSSDTARWVGLLSAANEEAGLTSRPCTLPVAETSSDLGSAWMVGLLSATNP